VAATRQSYIQQLNTLNAHFDKPQDLKPLSIKTKVPFQYEQVKKSIHNIIVSFKPGKKIATLKKVKLDRWKRKPGNFEQAMLVPRGALHDESIYGNNFRYKIIDIKNLENIDHCAIAWQKDSVKKHLAKYNNDLKVLQKNLKKDPIFYDGDKVLSKITIFENEHVKKYNLQYTPTNKFDLRTAERIVNANVKRLVLKRLGEFGNDPALAFKNLSENPLYFNKEKGIVIKRVRCYTGGDDYPALHETHNGLILNNKMGKTITEKKPVNYVKGGNNHHIALYEDAQGNRIEECVTFFEAFERKRNGQDVINYTHPEGYKFITSIQQNEMFVFGLSFQEIQTAIEKNDLPLLSQHLFRVQKVQPKDYWFRHHLETQLVDTKTAKELRKFIRITSPNNFTGIKVKVNIIGKISLLT